MHHMPGMAWEQQKYHFTDIFNSSLKHRQVVLSLPVFYRERKVRATLSSILPNGKPLCIDRVRESATENNRLSIETFDAGKGENVR